MNDFFPYGAAAQRGPWPLHSWGFQITHNDASQSVGLLWTSDQLVAETFTWQHTTLNNRLTSMPPVGFEPTISAGERPRTYALHRAATGAGEWINTDVFWLPLLHVRLRLECSTLFRTVDLTPRPSITAALNEHCKYYGFNYKYGLPYSKNACSLVEHRLIAPVCLKSMNTNSIIKVFSIIMFELRHTFLFFHNYRVLHKTVLRPYVSPPVLRPRFESRPGVGNYCLSVTERFWYTKN